MKMKPGYMIFCLFVIFGIAIAGPVVALSNYSISPAIVQPDTVGSVSVTFTNNGDSVADNLIVYYGELEGTAGYGPKTGGDLAKSTSTTIILPLKIPANYDAGVYSLPILIFYSTTNSANFVVPVTVSKPAILQVQTQNVSKKAVKPGEEFEVFITLSNLGGTLKDISMVVPQNSSFQLSGVSKYVLASLLSNSSAGFAIKLISPLTASTGTYAIPLTVTYTDRLGAVSSETVNIGPANIVDLATLFSVTAEPINDAEVGSTLRLNVTLFNHGNEEEANVFVEPLASTYIIPIGSTSVSFGTINPNGQTSKDVFLGIDPLAKVGYYSIPLRIRVGTGQSFNTSIGILVQAASKINVASETNPSILSPGATADLTIKISNIGDGSIRSVFVTLESDSVSITSGKETFLGTINVDETSSAVAKIRATSSFRSEDNPIAATITFKDSNNQEHKVEKMLYLSASQFGSTSNATSDTARTFRNGQQPGLIGLLPYAVGAIVVIVALFFGYKWWKGKKGKK